jgi:DNA polymerase-4
MWPRAIVFVDMNAFFASIEQRDFPHLKGKPVAVTNGEQATCIITSSYEARAYGIKTGMRLPEARRLCPSLIVRPSRPQHYAKCSSQIMAALESITPDIEVFSIDEAFLDVTYCQKLWGSPESIGLKVKHLVEKVSGLPCSVGVSSDKSTAKYAGNIKKPDSYTVIPPDSVKEWLAGVPVTELCGIGKRIGIFLEKYGVKTCDDMQKLPISILANRFGSLGRRIWLMAQGMDSEPVHTHIKSPQSLGHGKVLPPDTRDESVVLTFLRHMAEKVGYRLRQHNMQAQSFFIGVKSYAWGWMGDKGKTPYPTHDGQKIYQLGRAILDHHWDGSGLYQIQVTALNPMPVNIQKDLFQDEEKNNTSLNHTIDAINQKYGAYTISPAQLLNRTKMHDVIAPAWKPQGWRRSVWSKEIIEFYSMSEENFLF